MATTLGPHVNGRGHRAVGIACGLTLAATTHAPAWQWPITLAVAVATSAGPTSPDIDQTRAWRRADRLTPDEHLGAGGPLQHRGVTHWWALPALAALLTLTACPPGARWVAWAALTGWTSHLLADAVFGRPGCGRGPGIPLLGWTGHVGVGLPVGGALEAAVARVAVPATVAALTHGWWLPPLAAAARSV